MSSTSQVEGLQFPVHAPTKKQSTSLTGQEILSEALSIVDNKTAQQVLNEKTGEKTILYILKLLLNKGFLISTTQLLLRSKGCIKLTIFLIIIVMVNTTF